MNAFFSGTDDANENATQFYGVWGKVTDANPMFAFRWVCGDQKIQVAPDVLFDWPHKVIKTIEVTEIPGQEPIQVIKEEKSELIKGPFEHVDYPEDWMPQHTKAVVITPSYGGNSRYPYGKNTNYGRNAGTTTGGAKSLGGHSLKDFGYDEFDDLEQLSDEEFYRRFQEAAAKKENRKLHQESSGKKLETNLRSEVGNESLAGADVVEIHTANDFANLRTVENEAKDIAEDLRDHGFDVIIESAIDAVNKEDLGKKAN